MEESAIRQTWAKRHLAGWPVGLVLVVSAVLSAALVVPRAVPPSDLPLPVIDREEQRRLLARERALRDVAEPLPYEARAVGEIVRRFGFISGDRPEHVATLRKQLKELVGAAREQHGDRPLLVLRALQTELFIRALRAHEAGAAESTARDVRELGGELAAPLAHPGWYGERGFRGSDAELATLFRMRWNELCGVAREQPFALTLNEWRVYYRFVLSTPSSAETTPERRAADPLRYLAALGELDPDYPIDLARGVALYWAGAYAEAAQAFAAHLRIHPDGPWALRARNHLAACGAELSD